jgi:uncharacterized membrane protein YidH (DUF202 family)
MSNPPPGKADSELDAMILNEIQVLLSEKRTSLSTMRTGIAVFAFPLSVLSILTATSRVYQLHEVAQWLVPLLLLNLGLTGLGVYLIAHAFQRIHHYDRLIEGFKRKHSKLAELLE